MDKYKLITVAKNDEHKIVNDQNLEKLINNGDILHIKVSENSEAITKVFNRFLDYTRQNNDTDIIIFMHGDVQVDIEHMIQHIEECKDKYDIIGLCGTSIMNVSQSPLNWWTASNPTPQAKWGCVTHGELGNQKSFFSAHSPNINDHEVACIDGLCIIFTKKAINSNIKFDEQFLFDFYDTDISMQAVMKYGMKLGVIVEQSLQHYSVGKSILSEDFLRHEVDFRRKWQLDIPQNSPINKLQQ